MRYPFSIPHNQQSSYKCDISTTKPETLQLHVYHICVGLFWRVYKQEHASRILSICRCHRHRIESVFRGWKSKPISLSHLGFLEWHNWMEYRSASIRGSVFDRLIACFDILAIIIINRKIQQLAFYNLSISSIMTSIDVFLS